MDHDADLPLFARWSTTPDSEIDLGLAALSIAAVGDSWLDPAPWVERIDQLAAAVRKRGASPEAILAHLFDELGFAGNRDSYDDPKNSYLNEVLERRTGIPISLAVVMLEIARRAGVPAFGISFPGHFLVGFPEENGLRVADPFEGRFLSRADLRALFSRVTGAAGDPDPELLEPASKRQILVRMLANLRRIFRDLGDAPKLVAVLRRIEALEPHDPDVRMELESLGRVPGARGGPESSIN